MIEYTIHRVSLGSVFRVSLVLYGIIGTFLAFIHGLFFLILSALGIGPIAGLEEFMEFRGATGAIIIFVAVGAIAAFYAVFSALLTTAAAFLYNLLASTVGGIRLVLKAQSPDLPDGPPPPPRS